MKNKLLLFAIVTLFSLQFAISHQNYTKHTIIQRESIIDVAKKNNTTSYDLYKHIPSAQNSVKENHVLIIPSLNIQNSIKNNVENKENLKISNQKNEQSSENYNIGLSELKNIIKTKKVTEIVNYSKSNNFNDKTYTNNLLYKNRNLNNSPVNELTKEQCFELLDKMVKANNGVKMTSKNFTQYQASFNSEGFGIITDEEMGFPLGRKLFLTKSIKWEGLQSINISKLNFKHSCICLKFTEGFYSYFQVVGIEKVRCSGQIANGDRIAEYELLQCSKNLKQEILNNPNPSYINENKISKESKLVRNPFDSRSSMEIIVNNVDANKFVELIKRISVIEREEPKVTKSSLISKEKWNGDILIKWHEDNEGIFQGRYEEYSSEGKLVTFGDYKNNLRVGKWVVKGVVKIYQMFNENCTCSY